MLVYHTSTRIFDNINTVEKSKLPRLNTILHDGDIYFATLDEAVRWRIKLLQNRIVDLTQEFNDNINDLAKEIKKYCEIKQKDILLL